MRIDISKGKLTLTEDIIVWRKTVIFSLIKIMKTSTTIYYQGTKNNEMLLTDTVYFTDMAEID